MCLGISGRIKKIKNGFATVDFNGAEKEVALDMVSAKAGDYILVHAGFAIAKINKIEAEKNKKIAQEIINEFE